MDLRTLSRAYDRSAASYDERFRALQRPKYRAAAGLLEKAGFEARWFPRDALILDAGAGTGLFVEWLRDEQEPHASLRKLLLGKVVSGRFLSIDASAAMLRGGFSRTRTVACADLANPPLKPGSCALVLSFTALLENVPRSLRALGALLQPNGLLVASFLAREAPASEQMARWSGLPTFAGPLAAGQDLVHLVGMASPRIPLVLPVRFSFATHAIQSTSHELSTEGALVRCLEPPPLDTELQIRFYLPGSTTTAEFTARVSQVIQGSESGFWAQFTSAGPQARERLYALIAAHDAGASRTPVPIAALYPRRGEKQAAEARDGGAATPPPDPTHLPSGDGQNRRSFPRHRARFLVRFESVQEFVLQYAANISAGGVFISTDFAPPMDSVITVVLELPGSTAPVTARAQVVHRVSPEEAAATQTDAGAGVQFIDADDAFREGIDHAIDHILQQKAQGDGQGSTA
jgi:uncharacterized protein (TIGR02266 family)